MRINPESFEEQVKGALEGRFQASFEFEARLMEAVSEKLLLRKNRFLAKRAQHRGLFGSLSRVFEQCMRTFALHPAVQVATLFVLVVAGVLTTSSQLEIQGLTFSDLPALPKSNDFPAQYDRQWLEQREFDERIIRNAHQ